jgi:hypothetical protein
MHSHAPRLIVPLTGAHAAQRFPGGEAREDRFPAGSAHWAPHVMTHEIRNVGDAPVWAIVVEHARANHHRTGDSVKISRHHARLGGTRAARRL